MVPFPCPNHWRAFLEEADLYVSESLRPRITAEEYEAVKKKVLQFLEKSK